MSSDDVEAETTRITREGQVTIPKRLRDQFGLEAGDELRWEATDVGITVRKATQSAGRGMLVDDVTEDEREEMAEELEAKIWSNRRTKWIQIESVARGPHPGEVEGTTPSNDSASVLRSFAPARRTPARV